MAYSYAMNLAFSVSAGKQRFPSDVSVRRNVLPTSKSEKADAQTLLRLQNHPGQRC